MVIAMVSLFSFFVGLGGEWEGRGDMLGRKTEAAFMDKGIPGDQDSSVGVYTVFFLFGLPLS